MDSAHRRRRTDSGRDADPECRQRGRSNRPIRLEVGENASVGSVLVIGHNPGMHELAVELAGSAPELAGKFPTAALAAFAFHGSAWGELGPEATELVELTRPRDR
jgi:phosphohistidine phosphatase SixA